MAGLPPRVIQTRAGIVGIERGIHEKNKATDNSISQAFQDLKVLIGKAQEMVSLSRSISAKIKEKQGDISEDETVQFKSYLLSLGIDDPVTRDDCKSSNQYFTALARQISDLLCTHISESGGQMTLPNAFCRVNRSRGLDLVSPDDLLQACRLMESLKLPVHLTRLSSGVLVLQLASMSTEALAKVTADFVKEKGSASASDLSMFSNVPLAVAQERLQTALTLGLIVKDECSSGVFFMWNLFLYPEDDLIIPYLY